MSDATDDMEDAPYTHRAKQWGAFAGETQQATPDSEEPHKHDALFCLYPGVCNDSEGLKKHINSLLNNASDSPSEGEIMSTWKSKADGFKNQGGGGEYIKTPQATPDSESHSRAKKGLNGRKPTIRTEIEAITIETISNFSHCGEDVASEWLINHPEAVDAIMSKLNEYVEAVLKEKGEDDKIDTCKSNGDQS